MTFLILETFLLHRLIFLLHYLIDFDLENPHLDPSLQRVSLVQQVFPLQSQVPENRPRHLLRNSLPCLFFPLLQELAHHSPNFMVCQVVDSNHLVRLNYQSLQVTPFLHSMAIRFLNHLGLDLQQLVAPLQVYLVKSQYQSQNFHVNYLSFFRLRLPQDCLLNLP